MHFDDSRAVKMLEGNIRNEFRIKDWEHYYQISSYKLAEKVD